MPERLAAAMPDRLEFGDWEAEYWALRRESGIAPLSPWTEVVLTGSDRAAFLNRLSTNRVDRLATGTGAEAFLTDAKAHVLAYVLVFAEPDRLVLSSPGEFGQRIVSHLDYYAIREKVELRDRSAEVAAFLLAGAQAGQLLASLGVTPLPSEHLAHTEAKVRGAEIAVRTLVFGAEPMYLLVSGTDVAATVRTVLEQAGARSCGQRAREARRIEVGWPWYGIDVSEANLPQEVARERQTLSFTKGCYLGQEIVARLDSRGHVNKTLVGLRLSGQEAPTAGAELTADGEPVGRITSAACSPGFGGVVALGFVRRGHNTPGTSLAGDFGPVEVVALPMRHLDE